MTRCILPMQDSSRILVSYRTLSNILVALSGGKSPRIRGGFAFLGAEGHTSHLRSVTPRFAAKRFLLPEHCAALVTALQEYSVHDAHIHAAARRSATAEQSCCKASAPA